MSLKTDGKGYTYFEAPLYFTHLFLVSIGLLLLQKLTSDQRHLKVNYRIAVLIKNVTRYFKNKS